MQNKDAKTVSTRKNYYKCPKLATIKKECKINFVK